VLPHLRRQGIARRLVEASHDHLRSVGARRVGALVAHEEEDAVGLWLSAGYECDKQVVVVVRAALSMPSIWELPCPFKRGRPQTVMSRSSSCTTGFPRSRTSCRWLATGEF
jgi:hypothetical protein